MYSIVSKCACGSGRSLSLQSDASCITVAATCPPELYPPNTNGPLLLLFISLSLRLDDPPPPSPTSLRYRPRISSFASNHARASMTSFCISPKDAEPCPPNSINANPNAATRKNNVVRRLLSHHPIARSSASDCVSKNESSNRKSTIAIVIADDIRRNANVNVENDFMNDPR